jgi:hypothetical protein
MKELLLRRQNRKTAEDSSALPEGEPLVASETRPKAEPKVTVLRNKIIVAYETRLAKVPPLPEFATRHRTNGRMPPHLSQEQSEQIE